MKRFYLKCHLNRDILIIITTKGASFEIQYIMGTNIIRTKNYKLLLIDDEVEITEIVADIVNNTFPDIIIQIANTTKDAAEMMDAANIVISDVNMPDKKILDNAILKYSSIKPIARITGHVEKLTEQDLIIKKPFTSKSVVDMVNHLIGLLSKTDVFSD